jgi:cytochrome P450/NADPH-cytochrome P450 reductase
MYLPVINEQMRALMKAYKAFGSAYFDVPDLMTRMAYNSIGMAMMNVQLRSIEDVGTDRLHEFIKNMQIQLEASNYLVNHPFQRAWSKKLKAQKAEARKQMKRIAMDIIVHRREFLLKGVKPPFEDMLSLMMNASDPETGSKLSDDDMVGQLITFLVAGHETTSGLLSFFWYLVSQHPNVETKIEAKIASVLAGEDTNKDMEWTQLTKMTYIEQCLLETLRLYPTAPGFSRITHGDTVIGGFAVPNMTPITVPVNALHRDSRVWGKDALEFKPERFEQDTRQKREERLPHCFKPFGSGIRACIGMQFAMIESKVVVATTLQRFHLHAKPGYVLKIHQTLTIKPKNLLMKCVPRKTSMSDHIVSPVKAKTVALIPTTGSKQSDADHSIPAVGSKIYIVFGSNMGSSKEFATELDLKASGRGFDTILLSLDDALTRNGFSDAAAILCVTSTYNGFPPDNAKIFDEWLKSSVANLPRGTRYAIFGCGNKAWATFQKFPRHVNSRLAELGGVQLLPVGEADAYGAFEEAFYEWVDPVLNTLERSLLSSTHVIAGLTGVINGDKAFNVEDGGTIYDEHAPSTELHMGSLLVEVAANKELQSPLSTRLTRHIDFVLPVGVSYAPGDHLAVYLHNREDDVTNLAARLELPLDNVIVIRSTRKMESLPFDRPLTVPTLLTEILDLFKPPSRSGLAFLALSCPCPPERRRLEELGRDVHKYKEIVGDPKLTLLEVLDKFKSIPAFGVAELLLLLSPMKPRYYSISSSPKGPKGADVASITVAHFICANPSGRIHLGVASTYLKGLKPGDRVHISIKPANDAFCLPEDSTSPVIFVGAGTGLAPFMGFLQHRKHLLLSGSKLGPAVLFFGCRSMDEDFVYKSELEGYLADGVLSQLLVAFSREKCSPEKVYVQHLVQRSRSLVASSLASGGGTFHVCGDAKCMAPDVRRAVDRALKPFSINVTTLVEQQRYVEDCWAE